MREYKFRGRIKDSEVWAYGYYTYNPYYGIARIWVPTKREDKTLYLHEYVVDPDTVGQYTGLKDKNGTEIYEGDIVDDHFDGYRWLVVFDLSQAGFKLSGIGFGDYLTFDEFEDRYQGGPTFLAIEVIGNIYKNPELIEGAST